jgi:hypothetical protein
VNSYPNNVFKTKHQNGFLILLLFFKLRISITDGELVKKKLGQAVVPLRVLIKDQTYFEPIDIFSYYDLQLLPLKPAYQKIRIL